MLYELHFLLDFDGRWGFGKDCFTRAQRFLGLIEHLWQEVSHYSK